MHKTLKAHKNNKIFIREPTAKETGKRKINSDDSDEYCKVFLENTIHFLMRFHHIYQNSKTPKLELCTLISKYCMSPGAFFRNWAFLGRLFNLSLSKHLPCKHYYFKQCHYPHPFFSKETGRKNTACFFGANGGGAVLASV